jgi:flagellar protein FlbT
MGLKITLKPHERIIIGGGVVTNGDSRSSLVIENNVPILRGKEIMRESEADTPCRRIYFAIQLMYIDDNHIVEHHNTYWNLVGDVIKAAPSVLGLVDRISECILGNRFYPALKLCRKLIDYEQEVIDNVRTSGRSIQKNS